MKISIICSVRSNVKYVKVVQNVINESYIKICFGFSKSQFLFVMINNLEKCTTKHLTLSTNLKNIKLHFLQSV